MSHLESVARSTAAYGSRGLAEIQLLRLAKRIFPGGFRRRAKPSLDELDRAGELHATAGGILSALAGTGTAEEAELFGEYSEALADLAGLAAGKQLRFPDRYALGPGSGFLVYSLIRLLRPDVVVETGIANGHSAFLVLTALRRNGAGVLTSTDIDEGAGELAAELGKASWRRCILRPRHIRDDTDAVLSSLEDIDFFLHDSDHHFEWQSWEYRAALKHLHEGSILASDDVDASYAFIDFCKTLQTRPLLLNDRRKVFGLTRV